jgi:uncharacterized protein YbaR (Trm112 family)
MKAPHERGEPILITCPACAGVLQVVREPHTAHQHFICQIGHTFTLSTLLAAKEEELERSLWSAMCFFEHVESISRLLIDENAAAGVQTNRASLEARIRRVQEHRRLLRDIIEHDDPPNLDQEIIDKEGR